MTYEDLLLELNKKRGKAAFSCIFERSPTDDARGCIRTLRGARESFQQAPLPVPRGSPLRAASFQPESSAVRAPSQSVDTPNRRASGRNGKGDGGGGKVADTMGLKQFMHRKRVLDLYRGILKRARELDDNDLAAEARRQFKLSQEETDPLKIRMLVADARNQLEVLQGAVRAGGSASASGGVGAGDGGSWLDIDDPDDKRGRIGTGFPWER